MRTITYLLVLFFAGFANGQSDPPQNARQALLEMFSGKPGSFDKHLPDVTRAAMREAGQPSLIDQASIAAAMMNAPGVHLQTFETGSTLLIYEDDRTQSKFEVFVDHDDLRGDEDEIQVSFHLSKENQVQEMPVLPALTFLMKEEKAVWKLNELSLTIRVPLADPGFLKNVVAAAKARQAYSPLGTASVGASPNSGPAPNEATAIASMRAIVTAEATYASTYPSRGYTCTLSDLDGFGGDSPNEHQAMLIESRLASGKKGGYIFSLSGCAGSPSSRFQLSAVPAGGATARAFCANQTGVIRYSPDGKAATCLVSGPPIQ